jgi:DNA repair photolyase
MAENPLQGRGALSNPVNRFEPIVYEPDPDAEPDQGPIKSTYWVDPTRQIITRNSSPDVGFETSINPYRGCEHGCIYCFARPTHEYLGFSSGLDFETKILIKQDAPELLRAELLSKKWEPQVIAISGVTDPYQPIEKRFELTRKCLQVLAEFRNPVAMITKNHLITRDVDVLGELASFGAAAVNISLTTLDPVIARKMEPRASTPQLRLDAIRKLSAAGVPTGVLVAPVVPGITDHELPSILQAAADAGATFAGYVVLRLPHAVKVLFEEWLEEHFPDRKEKVLNRIRSIRDGKLNDPNFGTRLEGHGIFADQIGQLFDVGCRKAGLVDGGMAPPLSIAHFRKPAGPQMNLFG